MKRLLLSLLIATSMSGCTVGPNFKSPSDHPASYLPSDDQSPIEMVSTPVAPDWWRNFQSEPLNQTMIDALKGNYTLQAAHEKILAARDDIDAIAGTEDPQINVGADVGRQKYGAAMFGNLPLHIAPFSYYSAGPQVSYLLDVFGSQRRLLEKQKAIYDVSHYEAAAVKLEISGHVVNQAFRIAGLNAQIEQLNKIIADDQKHVGLLRESHAAGVATSQDILAAEALLTLDQARLPDLVQQRAAARHALAMLSGHSPAEWRAPDFQMKDLHLPTSLPLSLPSQLIHQRPDILAAEAELHAASADIGIATANQYPQITLSASISQQALDPHNLFRASANAWSMVAGLTSPLWDGGTRRAEKHAAEHAYQSSLALYRNTVVQSFSQVADVLKALDRDTQKIRSYQQSVAIAKLAFDMSRESYRLGQGTLIQVIDADKQLTQAQTTLLQGQIQQYSDTALLYLALGGGTGTKV